MIVPRARLIWWAGVVILPMAALSALPAASLLALAILAGVGAAVVFDAFRAPASLNAIDVRLDNVVSLVKGREDQLSVHLQNETGKSRLLRIGLPMPHEFSAKQTDLSVQLPANAEHTRVSWACTPWKRGKYRVDTCCLEGISPWGFWGFRASTPVSSELRVYPNLVPERKLLAGLFLNRGQFGFHARRQLGKGREFERLRNYLPGDSYEDIHWKATAKRRYPITKEYQIEQTQEVYVIIDAARLSARPADHLAVPSAQFGRNSAPENVLERFLAAALVMGLVVERQSDLFGVVAFSDRIRHFVRAKSGRAHFRSCREALYTLQPDIVDPDFEELFTFIRLRLRRRALLVFLTNLDDPVLAESFVKNLQLVRRHHVVLANMLCPRGVQPLFAHPAEGSTDELYQHLGGHLQWTALQDLTKVLRSQGADFSLLENERLCVQLVSQYMAIKQRQLL